MIATGTLVPFSCQVIEFLDAFSKAVLLNNTTRKLPEVAAVAHWMRKAHTTKLQAEFERMRGDRLRVARGIALHFAPANVDSIFLYSWFLSMLVGNSNIVRISQNRNESLELLLAAVNELLQQDRFTAIGDRSLILCYEHDDSVTRKFSEACHLRVLWGGDESVRRLRSIPMNPLASEIVFPNRFSLAAVNSSKVVGMDGNHLAGLAARFCNDAYSFDQMACSSPRLMVWVGSQEACSLAQKLFWAAINREIAKRGLEYPEVVGLNKLVASYVAAGSGFVDKVHADITAPVSRIHLAEQAPPSFRQIECGGGLFFEKEIPELHELTVLLNEKDQTLTYFGFERAELDKFARSVPTRALDRIVPIGSALNFSAAWDGNNLLQCFSREIDLQ